ncbi:hypothetical protein BD626DRAFT_503047 [Schizophyllum amplum]|uniref:Ubiquitin-like protease family profile domain-containing protein n=1 Tax=Schizophyllum amplum TaxID=97359 RepID=A0A550C836_9AGAR|nr:hypothetical protein BD626DRAFT_503047 [Auriculariopsis ampla]
MSNTPVARSADAVRAAKRRKRLALEEPERLRAEKEVKSEKAKASRRAQAAAQNRPYKERASEYQPRSQTWTGSTSIAASRTVSTPDASSMLEPWQREYLPLLDYEHGLMLPSAFLHPLKAVGAAVNTWFQSYRLEDVYQRITHDVQGMVQENMSDAYIKLSTGLYADYASVQSEIGRLRMCALTGNGMRPALMHVLDHCPPDNLRALSEFIIRFSECATVLRNIMENLEQTRLFFLNSGSPLLLTTVLQGAVDSAVGRGRRFVSTHSPYKLHPADIGRLAPGKWLNDEVVNFVAALWTFDGTGGDFLILPTSFATLHLDLGKTFALRRQNEAVKHGALKGVGTRRPNLWQKIIMPVVHDEHFYVVVMDTSLAVVTVYDSLSARKWRKQALQKLQKSLEEFVNHLCKTLAWQQPITAWSAKSATEIPQQSNEHDCGIYTLLFIRHLTLGDEINGAKVPLQYRFPPGQLHGDANGPRLAVLEEIMGSGTAVDI